MCLYTKQICPLRARKDIVCYKRFEIAYFTDHFTMLKTAIRGTLVRIPKTGEPTIMTAYPENCIEKLRVISSKTGVRFQIYSGMIHAFTNLEICNKGPHRIVLYKCIIPKGTLYYRGVLDEICAKKMLVIERVK